MRASKRWPLKTGCAPGDVVEALTSLTYHVPEQVFLDALQIATMRPQSGWVVDDEGKVPFVRSLFSPEEK
jgi:hypothetical protein